MARKIAAYTGKGVGSFDLSARSNMYLEPLAATIVMHDQKEHERVFTESEVKAIMQKMNDGFEAEMRTSVQFPGHLEVDESVVHDKLDDACEAFGITLDPA